MGKEKPKSSIPLFRLWTRCLVAFQKQPIAFVLGGLTIFSVITVLFFAHTFIVSASKTAIARTNRSQNHLRASVEDYFHERETKLVKDDKENSINFEQCEWLVDVLEHSPAVGAPLPEAGKPRAAGTFWLKSPLLHTRVKSASVPTIHRNKNSNNEEEMIILKYNIYSKDPKWTQHTEKFTNTIQVLEKYYDEPHRLFPKLYGYCHDHKGFHYVAVEFIDYTMLDLERPGTIESCYARADQALELFETLDEEYHMTLVDFKKGQWMTRKDGSLVLQDVDDIVPAFSSNPYKDQIEYIKHQLAHANKVDFWEVDRNWKTKMFPYEKYTIRYAVIGFETLLNDLGFSWNDNQCTGITPTFTRCKREIQQWTKTLGDDWPSPRQVRLALKSCFYNSGNTDYRLIKTEREKASWRDHTTYLPESEYTRPSACTRPYDNDDAKKRGSKVSRCEHSCCRAKGNIKCYYTAKGVSSC